MDASPNAEYIDVWSQILVPKFLRFRHIIIANLELHGDFGLRSHPARPGEHVLDVGCGIGDASLQLGAQVGPSGSVLGVDCAAGFIDIARRETEQAGARNVRFEVADAQTRRFEPQFELCFSRFGTMFFQSPVAALRNLRQALVPGGRLLMIVWRAIEDNPWLGLGKAVASRHLPPPPDDGRSCGPGPFSMADRESVTEMLRAAGFERAVFERTDIDLRVGNDVDEAVDFQMQLGPSGEIVREGGELAETLRPVIEADLRQELAPYVTERGVVLGSSSWTITAHNPR